MIVLGIDPGIARCGWGIIRREGQTMTCLDYGCIETQPDVPEGQRLAQVRQGIVDICKQHNIDRVGLEKLFFSTNAKTAFQVGQARGVIILALQEAGHQPLECTPNEVKSAVCGYGSAEKKQMQEMVRLSLKLAKIPHPDDAADALAIAMTVSMVKTY